MPHLTGVFEQFSELDKVLPLNLAQWLNVKQDIHSLSNILGNRIIYPQTIALSKSELEVDFAILREAVKQRPMLFYEPQINRLLIPELFAQRFPPLTRLAGAIIEAINPKGVIQIYIKDKKGLTLVGSLISLVDTKNLKTENSKTKIIVEGVQTELNLDTLYIAQILLPEVKIKIGNTDIKAHGGKLGVIIDLRVNKVHG